ncbi:hypothetical protein [Leucothrix pacifica]|uniref:Uncharacterized protein n=1 Tax=Leucothrix pacifica TaxID=1247513 RepID=A0A317CTY0_9GAMM|nr:hypothetical protein [Leucothrix pacifica]PWQ99772.1 hypothetical protein DKW60_04670 [Leucothrix pacifica]
MFGKFGGIVIIALAGAIIAGLILRPTPDLPPAMNLGLPDTSVVPANTLEPTADNQDKKPEEIKPVTETVDASEDKSEAADKSEEKQAEATDAEAEKTAVESTVESAVEKVEAAADDVATEATEAVEKMTGEKATTEGTEKSE